jgi:bacterioferritin B
MLISQQTADTLNHQVGLEFGAMLQYVAISSYFDGEGLPELAHHFALQAQEERDHAMRIVKFLGDADAPLRIPAVDAPRAEFASAEEAVQLSLEWEMSVTERINAIMDLAIERNEHLTKAFLDWFVTEQLEEVSSMDTLLRMIRRAGESGLMFIESHLARRLHGGTESAVAAD